MWDASIARPQRSPWFCGIVGTLLALGVNVPMLSPASAQTGGETRGWRIATDNTLEFIVHIHPNDLQQMMEPNHQELVVDVPESLRGRFHRMVVRVSESEPERFPAEEEIAGRFPISQARIPQTISRPGMATIDDDRDRDREEIRDRSNNSQTTLSDNPGFVDPPSMQSNPLEVPPARQRDFAPSTIEDNSSSLQGNRTPVRTPSAQDFSVPLSMPDGTDRWNGSGSGGTGNGVPSNQPAFANNGSNPGTNASRIEQPGFFQNSPNYQSPADNRLLTAANPFPTSMPWDRTGQVDGLGSGVDERINPLPVGQSNSSQVDPGRETASSQHQSKLQSELGRGASDPRTVPLEDTSTSWYFPLFFIISLVVNIYEGMYLFRLRERYRALLAGSRSGLELASS